MRKRALLIGINAYRDVTRLRGCVNDTTNLRALLRASPDGGRPLTETGGLTLEQAERTAADDDANVLQKLAELGAAASSQCRDVVDDLRNALQLQRGSSETLCNLRAAQGIGSDGEKLREDAGPLQSAMDARLAPFEATGKNCSTLAPALKADATSFLERRKRLCSASSADQVLGRCRDDPRSQAFCAARASGTTPTEDANDRLRDCLR